MYVKRVRFHDKRRFVIQLPQDGGGELPQATRRRMLLQGGNGSGKTTILQIIAGLWEWFGEMIESPRRTYVFPAASLWSAELVAMELGDFPRPGESFWIAVGRPNGIAGLKQEFPETALACIQGTSKEHKVLDLPAGDWATVKNGSQMDVAPLPNIVFFPPEGRTPTKVPTGPVKRLDLYEQNWLARFEADFDLDSLLFTVRLKNPERYEKAVELFDRLLLSAGKRVLRQEGRKGRLLIERIEETRPEPHEWIALSSGEKQMLLLLVFVVCLLRPDSILIIDEPDLHIHIGKVKQLLDTLNAVVEERRCQFIAAGHSQQLWEWFTLRAEKISLGPWRKGTT